MVFKAVSQLKKRSDKMNNAYGLAAISIFLWSTVATISKLLLGSLTSFQVLWASMPFAILFLIFISVKTGNIKHLKKYKPKDYIISVLCGIPGTFFYYVFYYSATAIMPASQAFIVNYLWPIMSVVFACIILKEKLTVRKSIAIFMSFLGVVIVTGSDILNLEYSTIIGSVLCVFGAVSYGLFTALTRKFPYDKTLTLLLSYSVTFIFTTIINGVKGDLFVPNLLQLTGFCWNGMFTVAVGSTCWVMALASGKTAKISNLAYITPFLSIIWTAIFLKEPITLSAIAGLSVIVGGIFIQLKDKN